MQACWWLVHRGGTATPLFRPAPVYCGSVRRALAGLPPRDASAATGPPTGVPLLSYRPCTSRPSTEHECSRTTKGSVDRSSVVRCRQKVSCVRAPVCSRAPHRDQFSTPLLDLSGAVLVVSLEVRVQTCPPCSPVPVTPVSLRSVGVMASVGTLDTIHRHPPSTPLRRGKDPTTHTTPVDVGLDSRPTSQVSVQSV